MKKIFKKIYLILAILIVMLTGTVLAVDIQIAEPEYTELYKQWLEIPEEQRKDIIEPRKYVFNSTQVNENNLFINKNVTLRDLSKTLKASTYSSYGSFSLMSLIPNNLKIKDQMQTNFCWAFASMSSLETNLALNNTVNKNREYDYSEKHMVYSTTQSFLEGQVNNKGWNQKASDGGTTWMATAYLTNGSGAINEQDMMFDNKEDNIDISNIKGKEIQTTVNDIRYFDSMYVLKDSVVNENGASIEKATLDNLKQEIKEHISTNGSIYAGIYMPSLTGDKDLKYSTGAIYCQMNTFDEISDEMNKKIQNQASRYANHAVSIIGWDDTYDKSNFATTPNNNGAWIIRNSYGTEQVITFLELKQELVDYSTTDQFEDVTDITDEILEILLAEYDETIFTIDRQKEQISLKIGKDGLFYVSYEDAYIYSNLMGIESAEDEKTYDNLYQHDELGGALSTYLYASKTKDSYLANVFKRTTTEKEYINSIGFQNLAEGTYEVYINPINSDKSLANLKKVELTTGEDITLTAGYHTINFKNVYELTGDSFVIAIAIKHDEQNYKYFTFEHSSQNKNLNLSNTGESFITLEGFSKDTDWVDIGNKEDTTNYLGNLCIKAITVNEFEGTTDSDKEEQKPITPENNVLNSDFNQAVAEIQHISIKTEQGNISFNYEVQIKGIKVQSINDKYEHYFYVSNNKNESNISDDKWFKVTSFEKQSDGTYIIKLNINNEKQLEHIDHDKTAYIYIKETATKGDKSSTVISNGMEIAIDTLQLNIKDDENEEEEDKEIIQIPAEDEDLTVADKILPDTGLSTIIVLTTIIICITIVIYKKCKKYKDIK